MISQMENQKEEPKQSHSDFSIEHILNRAGNSSKNLSLDPYSWLQCTRYCPPKIQRSQKREGPQKRQLGRHPRIPFTSHQLSLLEEKFQQSPYLSSEEVIALSKTLDLADIRVKIWFQNRRARERREKNGSPTKEKPTEKTETVQESTRLSPVQSQSPQLRLSPTIFYGNPLLPHSFIGYPPFYPNLNNANNDSEKR